MDVGNRDFHFLINNLFCEYTENLNDANDYLEEINGLETSSLLEEFYKKYIVNLICLNLEEYEIVYENAKACLSIYKKLNQSDRDSYSSEYLFSYYYVIFLKEYFEKNDQIENELLNLKKEIQKEEKNEILDDLLRKINLYLLTISKENEFITDDNIKDFSFDDFTFLCEKTASNIVGQNNNHDIDFLSHYTSIGNSFNILEHKELWVTRYDFLNDKSEFKYIKNVLSELRDDFSLQELFDDIEKRFIINSIDIIIRIISYFHGELPYNKLNEDEKNLIENYKNKYYFVLSFSKNQDSLPLWGNYTDFNGVNLLLDNKKLTDTFNNQNQEDYDLLYFINTNSKKELYSTFYSGEVLYDLKEIKRILLKDFRKALDLHKKKANFIRESVMTRILIEITLLRRLLVKINYFSSEEEYRFVFALDEALYHQKVNFRCGKDSYIPYIKIPITLDNIEKIVVGPRNNSDLVVKGFEEYKTHNKLNFKVVNSEIPFR
ncbi:DUF2971 domain-containing protein [Mycoplasmatota bacterium]|nr:DUF2971 domain-containing protein [Mycoplasmatota bacterium]